MLIVLDSIDDFLAPLDHGLDGRVHRRSWRGQRGDDEAYGAPMRHDDISQPIRRIEQLQNVALGPGAEDQET